MHLLFLLGKTLPKQKSKNKMKPRDLNRKGAEKEGTDMDAFVNPAPTTKMEIKQDKEQTVPAPKDSNKESGRDISKDIKEKDNYESKKEKEILSVHAAKSERHAPVEVPKENTPVQASPVVDKITSKETPNKEALKESPPKIGDNAKPPQSVCNTQPKVVPNDVVDHAKIREEINLEALVAQKNEENSKVSALRATNEEKPTVSPAVTEKKQEIEMRDGSIETTPKPPQLKYTYKEDQWSPINTSGKKIYDRDFLMKLQSDPNSKVKPPNLPDLEVVLKDSTKVQHTSSFLITYYVFYSVFYHLIYMLIFTDT